VAKARLEWFEPRAQSIEPHRCVARQQHRAPAYRKRANRTMSPN